MTATASANGSIPPQPKQPREAAELYLRRGFHPIPLPPRSKKPVLPGWPDLRVGLDDLDAHFPDGTECNIGLLLGEPSGGLIDVDLDAAEALAAAPHFLPQTGLISGRKSSPRSHHWYTVDEPPGLSSEAFKDTDGAMLVELRSTGGQTVVGPSVHPSGEKVGWYAFTEPARVAIADLRRAVARIAAAALLAKHWPKKGGRQDAALALAGGLVRAGWSADDVENFIRAVSTAAGDDEVEMRANTAARSAAKVGKGQKASGWPTLASLLSSPAQDVIDQVWRWLDIKRKGASQKAPLTPPEPYRPFPTDALPQPLRAFVEEGAASIGCDPVYVALPALSVAASLIGNSRAIRLKRDWTEPSVLWTAIVGPSGTLKTPAFRAAVRPLYTLQRTLIKRYKEDFEAWQKEKEAYDARKAKAKKDEKPFDEEEPEKPTIARVVCGDTTIEKLAQLLDDNPKGLLAARDELGGWLTSFQRYKGASGGSDLQNWLELYQAGTVQYDRKTGDRPVLFVFHAAASVTGGIQPGVLGKALTQEYMDAGLGARILMAMPPKRRKEWTEAEITPEVREAYETLLTRLRELQLDKGKDGDKEPFAVKLTLDARTAWVAWYTEWAKEQAAVDDELAAAYSKLEGYAARLALLHHVVSRVGDLEDCQPVEAVSIEAGVTLVRWFAYETRRIYTALSETEDQKLLRKLVELLRSWDGEATPRRLMRSNEGRYKTAEDAEAALNNLVDAGLADWSEKPAGPKGGRPQRICTLRPYPTADKTDTTPDDGDEEDGGLGGGVPTQPPDTTPPGCGNPLEKEGSVGCVGRQVEGPSQESARQEPTDAPGVVSGDAPEVVSGEGGGIGETADGFHGVRDADPMADKTDTTPDDGGERRAVRQVGEGVFLVTDPAGLELVRAAIEETALVVGLDTETTGLDPQTDRVRLLTLDCDTITDGQRCTYLIDCFAVEPSPLWETLAERRLVIHNAAFDLGFLATLGFEPAAPVFDTMLLSLLLDGPRQGKGHHSLAQVAERHLNRTLDKSAQRSDWSNELTAEQLAYAAKDAAVLAPLQVALSAKIRAASLTRAAEIESRCLPAMAWLAGRGVPFDSAAWDALAAEADREGADLCRRMDAAAPPRTGSLLTEGSWEWDSPKQVQEVFAALGFKLDCTDDDTLAGVNHPLAALLRDYRSAAKRSHTYGMDWPKNHAGGRIYAEWRQCGCITGRMASSAPNLQNVPNDPRYRRCFAAPPGRALVKADYSQIELRIAAVVSRDAAMLRAYAEGLDLHTLTARKMLGKNDVTPQERKLAKPVNFGLIYGLSAKTLRRKAKAEYGLDLSAEDAERYRTAFFETYPGVAAWHNRIRRELATRTWTLGGRGVAVKADGFYGMKANYVVQGTAGDGFKAALGLLWERRAECPGAFPAAVIHDEVLVECAADQADPAAAWLTAAMKDGMAPLIAPVPVEVEVTVGKTWGGD